MNKFLATLLVATTLVAACDGSNPFDDDDDEQTDVEATAGPAEDTVADDGTIFATDLNADLTANAFEFDDQGNADPTDDILRVNNIPFDNSDLSGGGYTRSTTVLPSDFDVYESDTSTAPRQYFAVFRQATYSEVAAIGSGDFISFGFGGATAQQLTDDNATPASRSEFYTFTGDYAAVRVTTNAGGRDDVEYITGDANLSVDIPDFDVVGAVDGVIENRELFDVDGNSLGQLGDFISLGTAEIDFETGDIGSSTAVGNQTILDPNTGTPVLDQTLSGDWQGTFAGPNGEEIAGFVVLEGTTTAAEEADDVRETGVFIVTNTE